MSALSEPIETSVAERGVSPQSVWLDKSNAVEKGTSRFEAVFRMLEHVSDFTLLDIGCGPGLAVDFLEDRFGPVNEKYLGVDISHPLIEAAKDRWPNYHFEARDIIQNPLEERAYRFSAINGVLTARYSLPFDAMEQFAKDLLVSTWRSTDLVMSFNVMSPHVDWTREDLFHWPMDSVVAFCTKNLSRHINILSDYGLYEYTVQVLRNARSTGNIPKGWQRLGGN
jgi:SAM-dependent methyltransferase